MQSAPLSAGFFVSPICLISFILIVSHIVSYTEISVLFSEVVNLAF